MTFPLKFKVYKPKERLKEGDKYQTKPELGAELVKELREKGFNIKRVLADSLYGESHSNFISVLENWTNNRRHGSDLRAVACWGMLGV